MSARTRSVWRGGLNAYRFAPNAQGWVDPLGLYGECGFPAGKMSYPDLVPTQRTNARDTVINGFMTWVTQVFSHGSTSPISFGQAAANGANAFGGGLKAFACNAAQEWWQTRDRPSHPNRTCYAQQVETIDWSKYHSFEEAWAAIVANCNRRPDIGKCIKNPTEFT